MDSNEHTNIRRDSRKRSRSPRRNEDSSRDAKRHHHHHKPSHRDRTTPKTNLPFRSRQLEKHDFESYKALFGEYLDLQKDLDIRTLDKEEVRGRWKSFLGKWNRGELAAGWYDPETKRKADERATEEKSSWKSERGRLKRGRKDGVASPNNEGEEDEEEDEEEDNYGPSLPHIANTRARSGPTVPNIQDLQHRRELASSDHQTSMETLRHARKQDRQTQKERLEELAPRADPGSRERQLEKKRETAASNKAFADAREAGTEEVGDGDLMGDEGGGGVEGYKARVKAGEKKKNEREVRKEEMLRARAVEREERLAVQRRKEEKTMEMLKALARERFSGEG